MSVTPAVLYLPTRLAGCSVGPGINRGARKLARTPRVLKKKSIVDWFCEARKKTIELEEGDCNIYQ